MTSIETISVHVPTERAPVGVRLRRDRVAQTRAGLYEHYYGFSEVSVDPAGSLTDLLVAALAGLDGLRQIRERIRYVMHARSLPVVAPYPANPAREACEAVGLGEANVLSLTYHACASPLLAIDVAGRLLEVDGDLDARAVVLTGDKTFTAAARIVPNSAVMGEASTALLVRSGGQRDRVLSYASRTHGRFSAGPWLSPQLNAEFQDIYPDALAEVMLAAVDRAGLRMDQIDLVLPHNVNRLSWLRVLRLIGLRSDRLFLGNLPLIGHCFGSDPFVNLRSAAQQGRLRQGDRCLMTAVGLGATFSAMVLEH